MVYKSKWQIDENGRECSRCGIYAHWEHFGNNKHGTWGKQSWCGSCFREYNGYQKRREHFITDEGRECSRCGIFKTWDQFHRRSDVVTGYMSACRPCIKDKSRTDKEQGRIRNAELNRKYGIGLDKYLEIYTAQDGQCAICGTAKITVRGDGTELSLSVDHDHNTGEIRGLLCQKCNVLLGFAGDDIGILERAIGYLRDKSK